MLDNNLPSGLARGLSGLFAPAHEIIHIRDKFGTGSLADEDWIVRLATEGG
jgi:PIN like domain